MIGSIHDFPTSEREKRMWEEGPFAFPHPLVKSAYCYKPLERSKISPSTVDAVKNDCHGSQARVSFTFLTHCNGNSSCFAVSSQGGGTTSIKSFFRRLKAETDPYSVADEKLIRAAPMAMRILRRGRQPIMSKGAVILQRE